MASHPITVVYDYDDTLVSWKRFFPPGSDEVGQWLPGAQEALRELLQAGYAVVVASCRVLYDEGLAAILTTLTDAGFQPKVQVGPGVQNNEPQAGEIAVWNGIGKPLGYAYVDDRGVVFDGDHETVLEILREQLPRP